MTETGKDLNAASAPLTPAQAAVDDSDRPAGVADLAALVTGSLGLDELLTRVADPAVRAIPGADGAGVTLLGLDRPGNIVEALAASAPFVSQIDAIQYEVLDEGSDTGPVPVPLLASRPARPAPIGRRTAFGAPAEPHPREISAALAADLSTLTETLDDTGPQRVCQLSCCRHRAASPQADGLTRPVMQG